MSPVFFWGGAQRTTKKTSPTYIIWRGGREKREKCTFFENGRRGNEKEKEDGGEGAYVITRRGTGAGAEAEAEETYVRM